jgi:hypothetical protein
MDSRQRPNSVIQKRVNGEYFKLFFYYEEGRYELYNLTRDLSETTNLLEDDPSSAVLRLAREMNTDLRNWLVKANAATGRWAINGEPVAWPPADMVTHRIPTEIIISGSEKITADPDLNPFYPGPGQPTITLARSQVHDSSSNPGIPAGAAVTVHYSFDITAGPTGTIAQDAAQINKGIGVDDGAGDTEPLKVDADNGGGNPEWLKIGNLSVDEVVISDPGATMPTGVVATTLRVVNFRPAFGSSTNLIVVISEDADHTTGGDNDAPRSVADGTLVINKWENNMDHTNDFHFIVTQGTLWLKGLEVSYAIMLESGPGPEAPQLKIHDWDFGKSGPGTEYLTWFSTMDKRYAVEASTNLVEFMPVPGATNIASQAGYFTTAMDIGFPDSDRLFLRLVEQDPVDFRP